jgi:hypothetical protein
VVFFLTYKRHLTVSTTTLYYPKLEFFGITGKAYLQAGFQRVLLDHDLRQYTVIGN